MYWYNSTQLDQRCSVTCSLNPFGDHHHQYGNDVQLRVAEPLYLTVCFRALAPQVQHFFSGIRTENRFTTDMGRKLRKNVLNFVWEKDEILETT